VSNAELTAVIVVLLLLVGLAQLLGYLFVRLCQPKVVGDLYAR
jgi:Kef-type K+ transport system membrane component KefB